ncbi:MAG: NAD(P)H-dependent oxidoreductase [Planctomycetes bacterium]|nr:NAD(P)H-dependent oxidoreductase [Planctomycetota bacterium]
MAITPKVLAFAGSTREHSFNKTLVKVAAAGVRAAGGDVTVLDLRDLNMPLYDEDLETRSGLPEGAKRFKDMLRAHQGLLISSPEYNSSLSAVLKNAIDWASRPEPGEPPLSCFVEKVAAIMSASPGALGGLRGLVHLRAILGNIQVLVLPGQQAIVRAHEAFGSDGRLKDPKQQAAVEQLGASVVEVVRKLRA